MIVVGRMPAPERFGKVYATKWVLGHGIVEGVFQAESIDGRWVVAVPVGGNPEVWLCPGKDVFRTRAQAYERAIKMLQKQRSSLAKRMEELANRANDYALCLQDEERSRVRDG